MKDHAHIRTKNDEIKTLKNHIDSRMEDIIDILESNLEQHREEGLLQMSKMDTLQLLGLTQEIQQCREKIGDLGGAAQI